MCISGQWQSTCLAHICIWTPAPTAHRQGKAVTNAGLHLLLFLVCRNELITDKCPTLSRSKHTKQKRPWELAVVRQSSCELFIQKCQCQGPKGSRELLQAAETSQEADLTSQPPRNPIHATAPRIHYRTEQDKS